MQTPDYDDPDVEEAWVEQQGREVARYLVTTGVRHGEVSEWPTWHVAPATSIWAIESGKTPGALGWWVISGDHPTDYMSARDANNPRDALRGFAQRWHELATYMKAGKPHPSIVMGSPAQWPELAPMLEGRAKVLSEWAADAALWDDDGGPID